MLIFATVIVAAQADIGLKLAAAVNSLADDAYCPSGQVTLPNGKCGVPSQPLWVNIDSVVKIKEKLNVFKELTLKIKINIMNFKRRTIYYKISKTIKMNKMQFN